MGQWPRGSQRLQPAATAEEEEHADTQGGHRPHHRREAPAALEGRPDAVGEVHAVDARDEGQGQEDGGHRRQHLHHLVEAIGDHRQVGVEGAVGQVAQGLDEVFGAHQVVVDVAEVDVGLGPHQGRKLGAREAGEEFPLGHQQASQAQGVAPQSQHPLQQPRPHAGQGLCLQPVEGVLHVVNAGQVVVH